MTKAEEYSILEVVERYGMIDGSHHKQWVIDQILRAVLGPRYPEWRSAYDESSKRNDYDEWDEGIAP